MTSWKQTAVTCDAYLSLYWGEELKKKNTFVVSTAGSLVDGVEFAWWGSGVENGEQITIMSSLWWIVMAAITI